MDVDPASPTVGRSREFDLLRARWRAAAAGPLQVARLRGEPGIGKTVLLKWMAGLVEAEGGRIVFARGRPDAPPLAPIARMVADLVAGHDPAAVRAALGPDVLPLAGLVPHLGLAQLRGQRPSPHQLTDSLSRLLTWASKAAPAAVLVDDAHLLDRASRSIVRSLLAERPSAPIFVLLAERDEIGDERIALSPGGATVLPLVGLADSDLAVLVERECGVRPPPEVLAELAAHTGGNPGLLLDLLRAGGLSDLAAGEAPPTPEPARLLAASRLAWFLRSTPRAARLLRAAAVLGDDVQLDVLAVVTTPLAGTSLPEVLNRAEAARLLRRTARGNWRFTPGARSVLLDGFPHDVAATYHRRAARHLQATATARVGATPRIAEQLLAAVAPAGEADGELVEWVCQAADELIADGHYARAARLCRRTADLLGNGFAGDRAAVLIRLGRAQWGATGTEPARRAFLEASVVADAAREAGAIDADAAGSLLAEVVAAYTRTVEPLGRLDDAGRRLLEKARAALLKDGSETPGTAGVAACLVMAGVPGPGPGDTPGRLTARAYREARTVDEQALAVLARRSTAWGSGDGGVRLAACGEAIRLAGELGDPPLLQRARLLRQAELLSFGDRTGADEELGACLRLGSAAHAGIGWQLVAARATRALLDGRSEEAAALSRAAIDAAATSDGEAAEASAAMLEFVHAREAGGLGLLLPRIERLVGERPDVLLWPVVRARILVDLGRRGDAGALIGRFLADGSVRLPAGDGWLALAVLLADSVARLGDLAGAQTLYGALLPWSGAVAVWGPGALVLGSVARYLGELALVAGESAVAAGHLEQAGKIETGLGSPPLVARSTLLAATALGWSSVPAERARANRLRTDALDMARAHGLHGILADGAPSAGSSPELPRSIMFVGHTGAVEEDGPYRGTGTSPTTDVRCFGSFRLVVGGGTVDVSALPPRLRALLWHLAVDADSLVHAETLIEDLWPENDPIAARHNLQVAVSSLRRVLEPGGRRGQWRVLQRDGDAYRLGLGADGSSDLLCFRGAAAAAQSRRDPEAAARALAAYGGELIPEAGPLGWLVERREVAARSAAQAALLLAEARLADGDETTAVEVCRTGLAIDRYVDGLWRTLIAAAEAKGDHAVALRAERDYRVILTELGVSP